MGKETSDEKKFLVTSRVQADNSYSHDGKEVTLKGHHAGAANTVYESDLLHLQNNSIFQLHKANGFIDISEVQDEEPADDDNMLVGSSTQPATFTLEDDTVLQLGDVVTQAFTASKLSVKQWNKLADKKREKLISDVVATLALKEE